MAVRKTSRKPRTPRKAKVGSRGLEALECRLSVAPKELQTLIERAEAEGAAVIGSCKEPLGGNPLAIAVLPIDRVEPTPFQRDLSEAHHKKLAAVIQKTGLFLDPVIVVPAPNKGFWTPNGRHRLEAMRRLGAKAITALLVPDRQIAWQILALNTEKAHNLKERSLEVSRIYRGLLEEDDSRKETDFADYLEEAALITLGFCYEKKPSFAGGAYYPILRRVEEFSENPIGKAVREHEKRAAMVMDLEAAVAAVVQKLKDQGLVSPYLRAFVVARINPLRWVKEIAAPETVLKTMLDKVARFKTDKIRPQDLVAAAGAPDEE